ASQAEAVADLVKAVKACNSGALYVCDPVMGDSGGLYVPEATAHAVRDQLLPLADLATPNRYELEWLSAAKLPDLRSTIAAALDAPPPAMLVTSAPAMLAERTGNLFLDAGHALLAEHRMIEKPPNGLGDLTAAVYLARMLSGQPPATALQSTTAAVYEILATSTKLCEDELQLENDKQRLMHTMASVHLHHLLLPGHSRSACRFDHQMSKRSITGTWSDCRSLPRPSNNMSKLEKRGT